MKNRDDKEKNLSQDNKLAFDFRYESKQEAQSEAIALMEGRLRRMKNLTKTQIIMARLMQLKLKMEDYLVCALDDQEYNFSRFLRLYIDIIYSKRRIFAGDINIEPVKLSQIINHHREPNDEFLMKLMFHSEKVFERIGRFDSSIWQQVYFHDKMIKNKAQHEKYRNVLEKEVQVTEPFGDYKKDFS